MTEQTMASASKRLFGGVIDLIILFFLVMLLGQITGNGTQSYDSGAMSINVDGGYFLVNTLIVFVLFAVMEHKWGKTPGKFIAGTKVVSESGTPISFKQSLIRNLMRFIDGLFFYLVGFIIILTDKKNQRLGDMTARTLVVSK